MNTKLLFSLIYFIFSFNNNKLITNDKHNKQIINVIDQIQRIIAYEEDLFKRLRNTSGKMWNKMVETRPELASITNWMLPGLLDGYKNLQSMLKEL